MKRVFCVVGGSFLLGSLMASFIPFKGQIIILIICFLVFLFAFFKRGVTRTYMRTIAIFVCLGSALFTVKTLAQYDKIILLNGATSNLSGTITEKSVRDNGDYTYEIIANSVGNGFCKTSKIDTFNVTLYSNNALNANLYDQVTLQNVQFFRPSTSDMFDSERYNRSKNIFICGRYQPYDENAAPIITSPSHYPLRYHIAVLNQRLCEQVDELMSPESAMLVKGIILGQRGGMDFKLNESYKDAGVAHLFSISGMHISILAASLLIVLKPINKHLKIPIVLINMLGYILLSGAQISAIRSGIMLAVMLISQLFYRENDGANSLFLAGFIIVLSDSYAIMDLGFVMSFLATFGVIVIAPYLHQLLCKVMNVSAKLAIKLLSLICISLSAEIMLLPVFILCFHTISIISPITNLITSVTIIPIVILGFLSVLLIHSPISTFLVTCLAPIISLQNKIVSYLGGLDFSIIGVDYPMFSQWLFVCVFIVIGALILHNRYPEKNIVEDAGLTCILLFVFCVIFTGKERMDNIFIYLIGDNSTTNIVIANQSSATIISTADDNYIDKQTLTFLKGKGIKQIDSLLLTYTAFEQYNDTVSLVKSFPVSSIFYNKTDPAFKEIISPYSGFSQLSEIEDNMTLSIGENIVMDFNYIRTNLTINLNCCNYNFYIGDYSHAPIDSTCAAHFIRGKLTDEIPKPLLTSIILQNSNNYGFSAPNGFISSVNKNIEIRINERRQLIFPEFIS